MKRFVATVLCAALLFSLASCKVKNPKSQFHA